MINKFYENLEEMAFDYALAELIERGKEITVYDLLNSFRDRVVDKIKSDIDFELSNNDILDIDSGIEKAVTEYLYL